MTRVLSLSDTIGIAPGVAMPRLGFGTYRASEGPEVEHALHAAFEAGYRGVDTASLYGNEASVGRAVRDSGLPRSEVFVATKVWNDEQGHAMTLAAFERSLDRLDLGYVDLYLVHWPVAGLMEPTWRAMEEIHASGRARAIGVCNFLVSHLEDLLALAEVPPAVDQVEHHPWLQRPELRTFCAERGIVMQAWAPVMRGHAGEVPELVEIGRRHGKSPEQVCLRWILQHGVTAIPKSVHEERIRANADVFDFELTSDEMVAVDWLDRGHRLGPDPRRFSH